MTHPAWSLDPAVTFLNHGSFGACPIEVLAVQSELRARLERQPVRFFVRDLPGLLETARAKAAQFVGADPDDLAFVPNATSGANAVLRSLRLSPGDELLTTNHAYNACKNTLEHVAAPAGARVVVARIDLPVDAPARFTEALVAAVTPRTRLALVDHITSPTGLVLPVAEIVAALAARGVDALVDGAHAPGMLPLDVGAIGAAYYVGNFHKWVCAPKGAGFLHVRRDRQEAIHPTVTSHGANEALHGRSRFRVEFDWTGTVDPTAFLCVPEALRVVGGLVPGGWPEVMAKNHALAVEAREILSAALGAAPLAPASMLGSLAAVPIAGTAPPPRSSLYVDPIQDTLLERYGIEVPVVPWSPRLVRISAQLYNQPEDYRRLAEALRALSC
jgi:isopenicillin-N epimerase